jgi:hypothetical protein
VARIPLPSEWALLALADLMGLFGMGLTVMLSAEDLEGIEQGKVR